MHKNYKHSRPTRQHETSSGYLAVCKTGPIISQQLPAHNIISAPVLQSSKRGVHKNYKHSRPTRQHETSSGYLAVCKTGPITSQQLPAHNIISAPVLQSSKRGVHKNYKHSRPTRQHETSSGYLAVCKTGPIISQQLPAHNIMSAPVLQSSKRGVHKNYKYSRPTRQHETSSGYLAVCKTGPIFSQQLPAHNIMSAPVLQSSKRGVHKNYKHSRPTRQHETSSGYLAVCKTGPIISQQLPAHNIMSAPVLHVVSVGYTKTISTPALHGNTRRPAAT